MKTLLLLTILSVSSAFASSLGEKDLSEVCASNAALGANADPVISKCCTQISDASQEGGSGPQLDADGNPIQTIRSGT